MTHLHAPQSRPSLLPGLASRSSRPRGRGRQTTRLSPTANSFLTRHYVPESWKTFTANRTPLTLAIMAFNHRWRCRTKLGRGPLSGRSNRIGRAESKPSISPDPSVRSSPGAPPSSDAPPRSDASASSDTPPSSYDDGNRSCGPQYFHNRWCLPGDVARLYHFVLQQENLQ